MLRRYLWVVAISMTIAFTGVGQAAAILSDNFDSENGGVGMIGYAGFANWIASDVDLIGNGFFDFYPGNGLYVDMESFTNGTLTSRAVFGAATYTLSFLLGNTPAEVGNFVTVSLGDFSTVFASIVGMPLTPVSVTFTTTSSGSLVFASGGPPDAGGSVVDTVALESSQAIPEPSFIVPLAVALSGFGLILRRKRRCPGTRRP